MSTSPTLHSRAAGALYGLAIGDALGMPTQMLPREQIVADFGPVLTGFRPAAADHPLAAGMPAGSVTDDTEQAVLLARLLLDGQGRIDPAELARRLVAWEDDMRARGSLDLLGPSTKRAVELLLEGTPIDEVGRLGTTNGAAMRVAPIGVIKRSSDPAALVGAVVEASQLTHNTGVALAGAAAVAAAVSAGLDGASVHEAVDEAVAAARLGVRRGHWVAAADVAERIVWVRELVRDLPADQACERVGLLVGTSLATQESVPAAFALLLAQQEDPWQAALLAASVGGDCDTIAAITGAIGGACHGVEAFPEAARATIEQVNALGLDSLAAELRDMPARLLHTGNLVVDLVMTVPAVPELGGDVIATSTETTPGGGFNVMAAAARQGLPVVYAGAHGTGPFGEQARAALRAEGITTAVATPRAQPDTGFVISLVDATGERTFVTSPGAEATLTLRDLAELRPDPHDIVYVTGYSLMYAPNRAALIEWLPAVDPETTVVVDPGPLVGQIPTPALDLALGRADWWSCNAREAALLTGLDDPSAAARALHSRLTRGSVLLRTGPDGCLLDTGDDDDPQLIPGFKVDAIDLNGAGDAHTGVFMAALADGLEPAAAARRANAAAALAVTAHGPASAPDVRTLDRFLTSHGA
jgi:ADP-ribosylglycohydrolase/sugar/nucleoside kinase (ribokinase family)